MIKIAEGSVQDGKIVRHIEVFNLAGIEEGRIIFIRIRRISEDTDLILEQERFYKEIR